jgi:hypothetical protein
MQKEMTIREKRLLEYLLSQAATMLSDTLLDTCADLEYRMSLMELGITE